MIVVFGCPALASTITIHSVSKGNWYYKRASYGKHRYRTFTPDATITVSQFIRQQWANFYDIDESEISVIHNPIDLNRFRPNPRHDRTYVRSRLGIPEDVEVIYYPQRLAKLGVRVLF